MSGVALVTFCRTGGAEAGGGAAAEETAEELTSETDTVGRDAAWTAATSAEDACS